MNDATRDDMSEAANDELMNPSVERDSEVEDLTGEVPVVDPDVGLAGELSELDAVMQERDQFKDIALRLQADFENYRKRAQTLQADEVDRATGKLVEALLPVLDACEAGYAHGYEGVEQIWSVLLSTLQKEGLEPLDLSGQPFDPNVAEAVMHEQGDGGEPVVSDVLRTGYRWKGKVLRAAMVKVKG